MVDINKELDKELEKAQQRLLDARQATRDAKKSLVMLKQSKDIKSSIKLWHEITAIIEDAEARIKKMVEESDAKYISWSDVKSLNFSRAYKYQSPIKTSLKTNDKSEKWVRGYLNNDGDIAVLENKAQQTIESSLKRAFIKKRNSKQNVLKKSTTKRTKASVGGKTGIS
jgi:hypothetical protein